jgi:hypothetical protein
VAKQADEMRARRDGAMIFIGGFVRVVCGKWDIV